jgi:AcrR family transcriptional regulator
MGEPLPTVPRKRPRQERAKATVDALVLATARVLAEAGYAKASTNRIAKVAGVSVGSLYQYFPNKEALVGELIDRHQDEMMLLFVTRLTELRDAPLAEAVRGVISALIEAHRVDPLDAAVHKTLFRELPPIGLAERMNRLELTAIRAVRTYLEAKSDALRPRNKELAAFLLVHVVQASVLALVVKEDVPGSDEAFIDELTAMVLGYLRPVD